MAKSKKKAGKNNNKQKHKTDNGENEDKNGVMWHHEIKLQSMPKCWRMSAARARDCNALINPTFCSR